MTQNQKVLRQMNALCDRCGARGIPGCSHVSCGGIFVRTKPQSRKEVRIYPPFVYTGKNKRVRYELYDEAVKKNKVGDLVTHFASAPGVGKITYEISKIDETGVYGRVLFDSIRELEPSEVR